MFSLLSLNIVHQNPSIFSAENVVDPDPLSSEEAICHFATMIQYKKFSYNTLFNSRDIMQKPYF